MIETFGEIINTWQMFQHSYYAGLLSAASLALISLIIVGKRRDFLGASLSQVSLMSIALILSLESYLVHLSIELTESLFLQYFLSIFVSIGFAYFILEFFQPKKLHSHLSVVVYLLGACSSVLLVVNSPHGTEEIHQLNSSSLIGANYYDVIVLSIVLICSLIYFERNYKKLYLFLLDSEMASTIGISSKKTHLEFSILIGTIIGVSLKVVGFLFCFAFSVLPALCVIQLRTSMKSFHWFAMALASLCVLISFYFSMYWDMPLTQLAVLFALLQYFFISILQMQKT
ncbi:MAG: metal ABC transporter permease [Candidatus Cloacimonetes bacterium]|nr:metal ABC transporter permease [Candidatus Cloacimonadota bacterium]